LDLIEDKGYVSTWRASDWSFYDFAWVFWAVLFGTIVAWIFIGILSVDDVAASITWILAVAFLFIGAVVAWVLGSLWYLVFRRFHLMLSKTVDIPSGVMSQEMDAALPKAGVGVRDVTRPGTNRALYESQVVYLLEDGTTKLILLEPISQVFNLSKGQTVVHLGPLGKANADLMDTVREAVELVVSRLGDKDGQD
jgi:hypothetical protein